MDNNFDQKLDGLKDLYQKKVKDEKKPENSFEDDFAIQFDHINHDLISPVVESVNEKFNGLGYNLEVVPSSEAYSDVRKAVQIILTSPEKHIDFLTDPYILVEGYPRSGSVRIAASGSTNQGVLRPVKDIDRSMIEASVYDLLKNAVA